MDATRAAEAFDPGSPETTVPGFRELTGCPVPPAPILEDALGYHGEARWVSFHWEPAGDELRIGDGQFSFEGHWRAFQLLREHPAIYPYVRSYNLGSSDQPAYHRLLLDRTEPRRLCILLAKHADAFLRTQWAMAAEPETPLYMSSQELDAAVSESLQRLARVSIHPDDRGIVDPWARMEQWNTRALRLRTWLDEVRKGGGA